MNHFSAADTSHGESTCATRRLVIVLAAIIGLTALNFGFHTLFNGPDTFKGRLCTVGYGFFPGPLFHPWDRYMDYFNMQAFSAGQTSALPPTLIFAYQIARNLTMGLGEELSALLFSLFQMAIFSASIYRLLSLPGTAPSLGFTHRLGLATTIVLCSYPVYFALDRGNFALLVCALMNFAVDAHLRERRWLAGVLIGLAAALRITPLILGAIYLSKKDFRYLLAALVTTMIAWALSVPIVSAMIDGYSLANWLDGFSGHSFMYTTWTNGLAWSSSLYNIVRFVRYLIGIPLDAILESAYVAERMFSIFSFSVIVLAIWRLRKQDACVSISILAWAFVALPHVTGDYYLAALIAPMILLATRQRPDMLSVGLIALLLVPKDYFYYYFLPHKYFDFQIMDVAEYRYLLRRGYMPSSIQSLLINPLLLIWLGLRLLTARICTPPESKQIDR